MSKLLQDINEIGKSRNTGNTSNENASFSSADVQGHSNNSISAYNKKKEMKILEVVRYCFHLRTT